MALHRDDVMAAAVALADEHGVSALTMRKLADRLGVEAMSLYHHVKNKDDILDGMVDHVFNEIALPPTDVAWRLAIRDRCVSARAALIRHRWAIGMMDSRATPGPHTLAHHNAVLGCLRGGGFSVVDAAHAFALIDSHLYGFVLQEVSLPFQNSNELESVADDMLAEMPVDSYPHLIELMTEQALQPGYAFGNEFEFGLDVVLDGLERLVT